MTSSSEVTNILDRTPRLAKLRIKFVATPTYPEWMSHPHAACRMSNLLGLKLSSREGQPSWPFELKKLRFNSCPERAHVCNPFQKYMRKSVDCGYGSKL